MTDNALTPTSPYDYELDDRPEQERDAAAIQKPRALAVMLHGFDLWSNHDPGRAFLPAIDYVRTRLEPRGIAVLGLRYDTHISFARSAPVLNDWLYNTYGGGIETHLFGYSMGGLVARQMVADGLKGDSCTTYCTPNEGTARWVPSINPGAASMAPWSQDLQNLNANGRDQAHRTRLTAIGYAYKETPNKQHQNDGVVELASAVMWNQTPAPNRVPWLYGRIGSPGAGEPHARLQTLPDAIPALDLFVRNVSG
ncbi:MAG: hypothetical protein ACU0DW_12600 [Shimia sp.]